MSDKKEDPNALVTRIVDQTRFYSNQTMMDVDLNELEKNPQSFVAKQPPMQNFRVQLVSIKSVDVTKGSPPVSKHKVELKLVMKGKKKSLQDWAREADALHSVHTRTSASELVRDRLKEQDDVSEKTKTD